MTTRYTFVHVVRVLSKKFINCFIIKIVSVSLKNVKMAPFWGKVGILHLSYLVKEFGDPKFYVSFSYTVYIIKFIPGKL